MISRVIQSPYHDIYTNIALERSIFDNFDGVDTLLLWSNNPCVVCGRNQNIHSEVNIEYAQNCGIDISRRYSGGGAVYQDMGNINYTIYSTNGDVSEVLGDIILPLRQLGIACEINGRNDILAGGCKISGFAYYAEGDYYMYHGTLLVSVDMSQLQKVLSPSKLKLQHNGVASVSSRVRNIADIVAITASQLQSEIVQYHTDCGAQQVIAPDVDTIDIQKLSSSAWIYGQSCDFTAQHEVRLWGSLYTISVVVHNDIVVDCIVNSDSLDIDSVNVVTNAVIGKQYSQIDMTIDMLQTHKL